MRKTMFSPPEDFSLSPLLAILPSKGNAAKLSEMNSSLYARYEKVAMLHKELADLADKSSVKRIISEELMLKHVLEWLEVKI